MLAPPTATVAATLDERCDVAQLAVVVVSLMAGRRIAYEEYPDGLHGGAGRDRRFDTTSQGRRGSRLFVTGSNAHCASATNRSIRRTTPKPRWRSCRTNPSEARATCRRRCRSCLSSEGSPRQGGRDSADVVGGTASARASDPSRRAPQPPAPRRVAGRARSRRSHRSVVAQRSATGDSLGNRGDVPSWRSPRR